VFTVLQEIDQDIFDTQTILCSKFEQTWTILDNLNLNVSVTGLPCSPTPLFQSDAVGGAILLTETGVNYCMAENITADIFISGANVMLDMNDRVLTGLINVSNRDVIVKDGKIDAPAPINQDEAQIAAVEVTTSGTNVRLLNLSVDCADTLAEGIDGRSGIFNRGQKVFIVDCCVQSGSGASSQDGAGLNGGDAGFGIANFADRAQIIRCVVQTGDGGDGDDASDGSAGDGGNGGLGIASLGNNNCIIEAKIATGRGGNGGDFLAAGNGGDGGSAGGGIFLSGDENQVVGCTITTDVSGNGGNSINGEGGAGGGQADFGTAGIIIPAGRFNSILDSKITTSNGGNGGNSVGDNGGNGARGGHGILFALEGNDIVEHTKIEHCCIVTGNGGNGGAGVEDGQGGAGGVGIITGLADGTGACGTEIRSCQIMKTGNAGSGGGGDTDGGHGILITPGSNDTEVRFCTISNTGTGITPGSAILDGVSDPCSEFSCADNGTGGASVIFSNFAYAIANKQARYALNGKQAEGGVASTVSTNRLDNVFVDCDVDQTNGNCDVCTVLKETTTFIDQPGCYCLSADRDTVLTISSDRVELNLNGFVMSSTITAGNSNNVSVKNGTMTNQMLFDSVTNGSVEDVEFVDGFGSVLAVTSTCLKLENLIFRGNSQTNIGLLDCDTILMQNIKSFENDGNAFAFNLINLENSNNIILREYVATNNNGAGNGGLAVFNAFNSNDIKVESVCVNNNGTRISPRDLDGLSFNQCNKIVMNDVLVGNNQSGRFLRGAVFSASNDITLERVEVNQNVSDTPRGILFDRSNSIKALHCTTNGNGGSSSTSGFFSDSCTDVLYDHCVSNTNFGIDQAIGFVSNFDVKALYISCVANDNVATDTGIGFDLEITQTSCIIDCIAKRNSGGDTGRGFFLNECAECQVKSNLALGNFGGSAGIGFEVLNAGAISTSLFKNRSQDHDSNYVPSGSLPISEFTVSAGTFAPPPTAWDNISVI